MLVCGALPDIFETSWFLRAGTNTYTHRKQHRRMTMDQGSRMTDNDQIILDKIIEQQHQAVAPKLTSAEYFEIFTTGQIVKDYDLSYEEIESGIVGNSGDGGVDAIYLFVNGELAQDDTDVSGLKRNVSIELILIQAKTSPTFKESAIDKLRAFTDDFLDLSKDVASLSAVYNADVIAEVPDTLLFLSIRE